MADTNIRRQVIRGMLAYDIMNDARIDDALDELTRAADLESLNPDKGSELAAATKTLVQAILEINDEVRRFY